MSKKTTKEFTLLFNLCACDRDLNRLSGHIQLSDPECSNCYRFYKFDVFHPYNGSLRSGYIYADEEGKVLLLEFRFVRIIGPAASNGFVPVTAQIETCIKKPMADFLAEMLVSTLSRFIDVVVSTNADFAMSGFDSISMKAIRQVETHKKCGAMELFVRMLEV